MSSDMTAKQVVSAYQNAIIKGDVQAARTSLGAQLMMFNGNHSTEPTNFQAHMFLEGEDIDEWLEFFIGEAGPHENQFEFLHHHERANAAIVVTSDTGRNKFRTWEEEKVTWMLGKTKEQWAIVGMFVRDLSNPES